MEKSTPEYFQHERFITKRYSIIGSTAPKVWSFCIVDYQRKQVPGAHGTTENSPAAEEQVYFSRHVTPGSVSHLDEGSHRCKVSVGVNTSRRSGIHSRDGIADCSDARSVSIVKSLPR